MMNSRAPTLIIIGRVAGGASAAAKARRMNEAAKITIFEKGPYVSFANCGLPYYVGNTIQDREDLLLQSPERLSQRFQRFWGLWGKILQREQRPRAMFPHTYP